MPDKQTGYPLFYIAALALVAAGIAVTIAAVIIQPEKHLYKGCILLAVALLNFGGGEILNHPKVQMVGDDGTLIRDGAAIRRRTPCGLGNLMDIVGLIMFFVAASSFLYER